MSTTAARGCALGIALILLLAGCALPARHPSVPPSSHAVPYPRSRIVTKVSWDFSALENLRRAHGSDIWPCTWAADGNLYCAWGDGGGFDGDSDNIGRVSLGFARITGFPDSHIPGSFVGRNVWGATPDYAESAATFGGKVDTMISVAGVLYAHGALWTSDNTPDPVHRGSDGPLHTLIWSTDLGRSWERAPWAGDPLGSFLNFGENNFGALDSFVYIYYERPGDQTRVYLKRVLNTQLTSDPRVPGAYQYLTGVDPTGGAVAWSAAESAATPVFVDPNGAAVDVVYNAPIGRFLLTSGHFPGKTDADNSAQRVGLFEGPHPWGPWSTVGYYDTWGNLGPESFGDYLGLRFPTKWISADGKTLWGVFSSLGRYDSFNLVKMELTVAGSIPEIRLPARAAVLGPGSVVTARGYGSGLRWSVARVNRGTAPDSQAVQIASGAGRSLTFSVPLDTQGGDVVRVTLLGRGGSVYRDYRINATSPLAAAPESQSAATHAGIRAP
ncbi:MAG: hypothetical protein JWN85_1783 [Gammaproteobacteria bacterium]|nr:hypothetical protein [Gammaproteobacteria bacterium]